MTYKTGTHTLFAEFRLVGLARTGRIRAQKALFRAGLSLLANSSQKFEVRIARAGRTHLYHTIWGVSLFSAIRTTAHEAASAKQKRVKDHER